MAKCRGKFAVGEILGVNIILQLDKCLKMYQLAHL